MTTRDAATIQDGSADLWRLSALRAARSKLRSILTTRLLLCYAFLVQQCPSPPARIPKNPISSSGDSYVYPSLQRTVPSLCSFSCANGRSCRTPRCSAHPQPRTRPLNQTSSPVVHGPSSRLYPRQHHPHLTPFRINTCESVSKQMTLTAFRMNTCEKQGEGGYLVRTIPLAQLWQDAAPRFSRYL
jgi:hypothetical protein